MLISSTVFLGYRLKVIRKVMNMDAATATNNFAKLNFYSVTPSTYKILCAIYEPINVIIGDDAYFIIGISDLLISFIFVHRFMRVFP